jgi:hypothetical protein
MIMRLRLFQVVVGASSLALTLVVLELIRRRKLKDELWLPWLLVSATPFLMSFWIAPWAALAHWLGIAYEPALLFVLGILLCLALILYLTVVVSTLMRQNLRLAQELALLRERVETLGPRRVTDSGTSP